MLQVGKPTNQNVWGIYFEYLTLQSLFVTAYYSKVFITQNHLVNTRRLVCGAVRFYGSVKVVMSSGNVQFIFNHYTLTGVLYFKHVHLSFTKNEKIIEQQLLVDQLSEELARLNLSMTSSATETCGDGPDTRTPGKRPCTVPFDTRLGHYIYIPARSDSRKVMSKH